MVKPAFSHSVRGSLTVRLFHHRVRLVSLLIALLLKAQHHVIDVFSYARLWLVFTRRLGSFKSGFRLGRHNDWTCIKIEKRFVWAVDWDLGLEFWASNKWSIWRFAEVLCYLIFHDSFVLMCLEWSKQAVSLHMRSPSIRGQSLRRYPLVDYKLCRLVISRVKWLIDFMLLKLMI